MESSSRELLWQSIDSCEAFNTSRTVEVCVEVSTRRKSEISNVELLSSIVVRSPALFGNELSLESGDVISQLSDDDADDGDGVSFVIDNAASLLPCNESSHVISNGRLLERKMKHIFR